jgi:hypothetical protein
MLRKALRPILILFAAVNVFCAALFSWIRSTGMDPDVLLVGNLIVCLLTLLSFYLLYNGLKAKSTAGFLSSVYSSFLIKLFVAGIIVFVYSKMSGGKMNMPGVFSSMFLYLVYMFIELKGLLTLIKSN